MSLQSLLATFAAVAVCVAAQPSTAAAQGAVQAEAEAAARPGLKRRVAVGRFTNSTPYGLSLIHI